MARYWCTADTLVVVAFLAVSLMLQSAFNRLVPNPVVDEKFHVDQVVEYCRGNWSYWNEKITTPPGLYAVTVAFVRLLFPFNQLLRESICQLPYVRFISQISLTILLVVTYKLLHDVIQNFGRRWLNVFCIVLSPIIYMYSFLFYTDLLSLLTVAAMTLVTHNGSTSVGSFFALLSILCRQSNIVWVFFSVTGQTTFLRDLRLLGRRLSIQNVRIWATAEFMRQFGYILVAIGFIIAVYVNKGLALGDRSAHQPCPHVAQLFYFSTTCLIISFPLMVNSTTVRAFWISLRRRKMQYAVLAILMALLIRRFTYVHPYLLADNRHITFYIWRKWFMRHDLCKYLLIPVYMFSIYTMNRILLVSFMWKCFFWLSVSASTVPNRLLEPRYFIAPYFIWRINIPRTISQRTLTAELCYHVALNVLLFSLFIYKTFYWVDETYPQRIML